MWPLPSRPTRRPTPRPAPRGRRARMQVESVEARLVPTAVVPPPGLVSWWAGDGDALDITGPNHGTLQNGAGHYQGYVADDFNFDGQDDLLQAPTSGLPTGSADRTLMLWARINQQPT